MKHVLVLVVLAACTKPPSKPAAATEPSATGTESEQEHRTRLVADLQDEILASYERDELPDVETRHIPAQVGPARIDVGPGDVLFGDDVRRLAWSRWPLQLEPGTPTAVRSKRLEIHLSADKRVDAAWMSDELSWRITLCKRTAVIPLRITALYAHDGDRWVQVFEHLSFARMPEPAWDGKLRGAPLIKPGETCPPAPAPADHCPIFDHPRRDVSDELSRVLQALLSTQTARIKGVVALDPVSSEPTAHSPLVLIAPDPEGEWHGPDSIEKIRFVDGKLKLEDRRIGVIGSTKNPSVAYWVGNLIADLRAPAGQVRLRGTFVFEKRYFNNDDQGHWVVVQGHISEPIDDLDLAQRIYGTALISEKPLQITCDDGRRSVPQLGGAGTPAPTPGAVQ